MANDSAIDRSFSAAFNEANQLYIEDKLEECIQKARELLEEPAIPRYHRMKTLILLGQTVPEWSEANDCLEDAEMLWRITRRWHPAGNNSKTDEAMTEIRASLDELKQALIDEQPEEYDAEAAIEERIGEHDRALEEEMALAAAENDDDEELLAADANVLDMPIDALRELDVSKAYGKAPDAPRVEEPAEPSSAMEVDPPVLESSKLRPSSAGGPGSGWEKSDTRFAEIMRKPSWRRQE